MTELSHQNLTASEHQDLLSRPLLTFVQLDWEKGVYLAFILIALVTRLWGLGDRVVSHDESLHTQYSYQYYAGDGYRHTPLMHGPSLFHLTALSYWMFGDSDFSSRLPVALIGILLVVAPYFLRDWIGRFGAVAASFLLLISPYITYYSRYIRHDIYIIAAAVIVFTSILYYLRDSKDKYVWWFALGVALMFVTMETSFIYVAIFGSFLVIRLGVKLLASDWLRDELASYRQHLLVIAISIVLISGGFLGQRLAPRMLGDETPEATVTAEEGFAADPNEQLSTEATEGVETGTVLIMRWLQVGGIGLLALGLFQTARQMRPHIDQYAEFDLVVLFTTLVLPTATAFLVVILGRDPLNYTLSNCEFAGQATMSSLELFFARAGSSVCREAFISSGMIFTGFFLVLNLAVSVAVGLWWDRRRWPIAAVIFHAIFLIFYTSFFTNPSGWISGMVGSLGYWLAQQEVQRADQPTHFYAVVLPLYEFLPLLLTFLAAHFWARKHRLNRIIVYWLSTIIVALMAMSLVSWFTNQNLPADQEPNDVAGIIVGLAIVIAAGIVWFLGLQPRLMVEYDLRRSWQGLVSAESLVGFVPFLIWWFILTWLIYSLAGEKMAWLSTHFIYPMVLMGGWYLNEKMKDANLGEILSRRFLLLTGLILVFIVAAAIAVLPILLGEISLGGQEAGNLSGLGRIIGGLLAAGAILFLVRELADGLESSTVKRAWLAGFLGLLALLTVRFNYMASFRNADYVTEYLVYAHGAPATKAEVMNQLESLSMRLHGDKSIKVAFDNDSSWPFTWYLRDYPNRLYFGENPGRNITDAPIAIVGSQNWGKVEPLLGDDYEARTYTFLWWPMEEYKRISWNAVLGDPAAEPENKRGLGKPAVRQALWDIFLYRDYQKYGQVFGGNYSVGQWPLRHDLRVYIRKDTLAALWDHGIDAVAAEPPVDPYAENELPTNPILVIGSTGSSPGQLFQPRNVAIGPDGLIYVADSGNHRIQVFDPEGQFINGWGAFGNEPGLFNEPWALAVDQQYVYVSDTWNHRLQKFTLSGEFVQVIGQSGSPAEGEVGGGLFFGPRDVLLLPDGNLLVTDTGNHRLQLLDTSGNFLSAFGGQGTGIGQFYEPVGMSLSPSGDLYIADTWNGRVQQFNSDLFPVNEWPVEAWFGESINNKPYVAVDGASRVYITDPEGYRVIIFDEFGQYLGRFGSYGTDIDTFGLPNGIAVDSAGNIFVADAGNNRILKFAPPFAGSDGENQTDLQSGLDEESLLPADGLSDQDESLAPTIIQEETGPTPTEE